MGADSVLFALFPAPTGSAAFGSLKDFALMGSKKYTRHGAQSKRKIKRPHNCLWGLPQLHNTWRRLCAGLTYPARLLRASVFLGSRDKRHDRRVHGSRVIVLPLPLVEELRPRRDAYRIVARA